jgi:hypothetical protein
MHLLVWVVYSNRVRHPKHQFSNNRTQNMLLCSTRCLPPPPAATSVVAPFVCPSRSGPVTRDAETQKDGGRMHSCVARRLRCILHCWFASLVGGWFGRQKHCGQLFLGLGPVGDSLRRGEGWVVQQFFWVWVLLEIVLEGEKDGLCSRSD